MPFVSITRLRVRSWRFLPIFFVQALRSGRQAAAADGNLATRLLRERRNTFWTMTSWSSEAAMKAFMHSGVHGPVMRKLLNWCDEAAVGHWPQESTELPTWPQVHTRMQQDGRRSKVNHPSAAHTAFEIPAPSTTRDLRLK
jgi:heme-degrading monooxygenase HmoA